MVRNSLQKIRKKGERVLKHYYFGDMLRQARKELNLTQEELAFGICSVGTISKIENGTSVPRRRNYEALMQRIGKASCMQQLQMSFAEEELQNLIYEIRHCVADNAMERAAKLLDCYFPLNQQNALNGQFAEAMWAIIDSRQGMPPDEVLEHLKQALSYTGLSTETFMTLKRFYTFDEMILLNNIAIQYLRKNEYREAFLLWDSMKVYLEKRSVEARDKGKIYPMVQYNYALMCLQMGMPEQCRKNCREGIRFCEEQKQQFVLPYLLSCLSRSLEDETEEQRVCEMQAEEMFRDMASHQNREMEPLYLAW